MRALRIEEAGAWTRRGCISPPSGRGSFAGAAGCALLMRCVVPVRTLGARTSPQTAASGQSIGAGTWVTFGELARVTDLRGRGGDLGTLGYSGRYESFRDLYLPE